MIDRILLRLRPEALAPDVGAGRRQRFESEVGEAKQGGDDRAENQEAENRLTLRGAETRNAARQQVQSCLQLEWGLPLYHTARWAQCHASGFQIDLSATGPELLGLSSHLGRRVVPHFMSDLHGTELRPAHRAEVGQLGAFRG